jgi:hypothetical protein
MILGRTELFRDADTYWHTVLGQMTLQQRAVVTADTFSFTCQGERWTDTQWLAECVMAAIYGAAGWDGLLLATTVVLAATYAAIVARLSRAGLTVMPTVLLLMMVLAASSHQFHVRPLVLTIALLSWTFALLADVEAGRAPAVRLWWLVPAFVIWTNVHGGVLAGLGTVGLAVGGWGMAASAGWKTPLPRRAIALLPLLPLCCLVNPYGLDLPRAWWEILTLPLPSMIQEHAPLNPSHGYAMIIVLLGLAYVAALAGVKPRQLRVTWLLPLVWFALTCQRVRNAPLFAVTAAIALADVLPATRWAGWLTRRGFLRSRADDGDAPQRMPRGRLVWTLLPVATVLLTAVLQVIAVPMPVIGRGCVQPDRSRWPVELLPELRAIATPSAQPRLFNDMLFGGFLIYHAPGLKVFIDGRCELYGREFLLAYDRLRNEEPAGIEAWADAYGFRHALVEPDTPLDRYLGQTGRWRLVRRTAAGALYRQRVSPGVAEL